MDPRQQQCGATQAQPEVSPCPQNEASPMLESGPNLQLKMAAKPAISLPMVSGMLTSSSQRDTQTRLISSSVMRASQGKDEYLLRLLGKPPLPAAVPSPSSGFRVPDPVPLRGTQALNRPSLGNGAATETPALEKGSGPGGATGTASVQVGSEVAPGWSYADTKRKIGANSAAAIRSAAVAHQVAFLEQLYDLHRAIAVQKLLVRNCPEVKPLMAEAARILMSTSSGQKESRPGPPPAKRPRLEEPRGDARTVQDDDEPGLRPDSQFAAVPLPGETAGTGDGSGDDVDGSGGSGGNGSGGGSNSPQPLPQLPMAPIHPARRIMPPLQAAPSGASQTPIMFPRTQYLAPPWYPPPGMPMQMQVAAGMYPGGSIGMDPAAVVNAGVDGLGAGGSQPPPPPMQYFPPQMNQMGGQMQGQAPGRPDVGVAPGGPGGPPGVPIAGGPMGAPQGAGAPGGGDPMAWWYENYYGRPQMQPIPGMGGVNPGMPPPPMQTQHAQQMASVAAMTAFGPPRWWQDCHATFGPPADLQVIAAAHKAANGGGEVESAPPSTTLTGVGPKGQVPAGGGLVAAPVARRSKRKPSDPIEEASSGTTGQDHHLGPHAVTDDAHFKSRSPRSGTARTVPPGAAGKPGAADTSAARLLLSMSGKGVA